MRVIIRVSVDNEPNSALRNKLYAVLTGAGFVRAGNTATYEHQHIPQPDLRDTLNRFWKRAISHTGPGRIDHFWMYSDRTELDNIHPANAAHDDDD